MPSLQKRGRGRPRCNTTVEDVRQVRSQGLTWRQIGKRLGIGSATAMRLYSPSNPGAIASQNSSTESDARQNLPEAHCD